MGEYDGQQVGNYRLIRRLGRGGTAEVYLGEHIFLNTQAALKILQAPSPEQDAPAFLREARLIAGLTHPHIVRVLDFGVQGERFYLVMEYAARGTLRQNYPPGTRLPPPTVVGLVKQVADALQYAHNQQIIHCDVKPENMLLGTDERVLLSDFGISLVLHTMSVQVQQIAGTIAYMAPEQFTGKPQQASDQYALAVIVYEWLSGERPFQGNLAEISGQHLYSAIPPLREKIPGISAEVDEVLGIAMEKDPARRFRSISAFARALEHACVNLPAGDSTFAPAPIPRGSDITPQPGTTSPLSGVTQASRQDTPPVQRTISTRQTPAPYPIQPAWEAGPWLQMAQRTPDKHSSRRAFLAGLGGGAVILGVAGALLATGKLTALFAQNPVTPTSVVTATPIPHPGSEPTVEPTATQSPVTSNIPLGTTLTTYTGQSSDVTAVCWSPALNSRMVASCSLDGSAAIWHALTGHTTLTHRQNGTLNALIWSPNGRYLASAGDASVVEVWDATSGSLLATCVGHTQPIYGLAWSPDSQHLVSTSADRSAIVWNAATGSRLSTYTGHTDVVWVPAWAPNGNAIATGSWDSTVQIWSPATATLIRRYQATQRVRAVDWSPDSSMIASGSDDASVQVWQVAHGNVLAIYRGHSDDIEAVQWSPDGRLIASASKDTTAQIWQATDAAHIYTYTGHSRLVWSLAWSPDGQLIATGSQDQTARIWQAR